MLMAGSNFRRAGRLAFVVRASAHREVGLALTHGALRAARVVDERGHPIAGASLFTACDGHVKSLAVTNAEGRGNVAVPKSGTCAIYALP